MPVALAVCVAAALGFAFAGSPARLPENVRVAGVDVGGLETAQARTLLERRAARLAHEPVTVAAADERFHVTAAQLGVEVDWGEAVDAARDETGGIGPVRGLRRLETRVFGAEVAPPTRVSAPALRLVLEGIAQRVRRSARDAAIVLHGLRPVLVPSRRGRALDRRTAAETIVRALASLSRSGPVVVHVRTVEPRVRTHELRSALAAVETAVSAPVRLQLGPTRWRLARWRVAPLLALPGHGSRTLTVGGPAAMRLFARLHERVDDPPRDARFVAEASGTVSIHPSRAGTRLDTDATARRLLAAATSRTNRLATVAVHSVPASLTTAEARALGITRVLSKYSTAYAGTADRIHNLQLAVSLLDGTIVRPGHVFSLNRAVGRRTAGRGFRPAPVIVNDEYAEAIGGGTSQVATTTFNAAWEAGLKILERNPHSLYIARYPLGRDATVNYPDLDLRFLNDTGRPLVVRGFSSATGITVAIYGATTGRRVVSKAGPLTATGPAPLQTIRDPTLPVGTTVVESDGVPPQSVAVERTVLDRRGHVLYHETWRTSYRGEARIVRVGTKPKPKPPPAPPPPSPQSTERTKTSTTKGETTATPPPPPPPRR